MEILWSKFIILSHANFKWYNCFVKILSTYVMRMKKYRKLLISCWQFPCCPVNYELQRRWWTGEWSHPCMSCGWGECVHGWVDQYTSYRWDGCTGKLTRAWAAGATGVWVRGPVLRRLGLWVTPDRAGHNCRAQRKRNRKQSPYIDYANLSRILPGFHLDKGSKVQGKGREVCSEFITVFLGCSRWFIVCSYTLRCPGNTDPRWGSPAADQSRCWSQANTLLQGCTPTCYAACSRQSKMVLWLPRSLVPSTWVSCKRHPSPAV